MPRGVKPKGFDYKYLVDKRNDKLTFAPSTGTVINFPMRIKTTSCKKRSYTIMEMTPHGVVKHVVSMSASRSLPTRLTSINR